MTKSNLNTIIGICYDIKYFEAVALQKANWDNPVADFLREQNQESIRNLTKDLGIALQDAGLGLEEIGEFLAHLDEFPPNSNMDDNTLLESVKSWLKEFSLFAIAA